MNVAALRSLLWPAPESLPRPRSSASSTKGCAAYQAGKPADAERAWKAGYQVGKDPAFLVHIGEAAEKAGAVPEAVESYRHYLREAPDASDRAEIEQRLTRLGASVAAPAERRRPRRRRPGGRGGDAGRFRRRRRAASSAPPPGAPPPAAPATPQPARDSETARMPEGPPSGWNARNITAWISVAAAAALLGTAGFYAASAGSKKDDVDQLLALPRSADRRAARVPERGRPVPERDGGRAAR